MKSTDNAVLETRDVQEPDSPAGPPGTGSHSRVRMSGGMAGAPCTVVTPSACHAATVRHETSEQWRNATTATTATTSSTTLV